MSHPEWPKNNDEYAPPQIGEAIYQPLKAADIECGPPGAEGLSKRAKKLGTVSRVSPSSGPGRRYCRGGELLPARRALFQIDVLGPRNDVGEFVSGGDALMYGFGVLRKQRAALAALVEFDPPAR